MQTLQQQERIRFCEMTGLEETAALHQVIDAGAFDTALDCLPAGWRLGRRAEP